ncbi:B3/B4 domain-containing protein [Bacillus rubiinfantis]|uniref:B3/B4 domain-containing protein n=1 Tax=Bacillus rubiinfantis TaxID=1499680 RepID=UPI0005A7815F|nr:phenylalanine--tRNA ligase beta subunit-related protein [Bacillus rubiinfantis]
MEIILSTELTELIPNFKLGVIEYEQITVGDSPQMLKGRLQLFQESLYFELENKNVTELPGIQEWRAIFKQTGKDPNRYRHSAEALFRRVKKQNYLGSVNSATDLNNFFSLQYQIPMGIYDVDSLKGPIIIRIGEENEEYQGLNGRVNSLHKLIISSDENGPFGSPFVDSERSAVTVQTKNALQLLYLQPSLSLEESTNLTSAVMNMFTQINGGDASFTIIG